MADLGNGTTLVFGTSGFKADILSLQASGAAREAIDVTHLGTPRAGAGKFGSKVFIPSGNTDPGELRMEILFDPDEVPPLEGDAETATLTFPLPDGQATPAKFVGSGFVTSFEYGVPLDDKMTGTVVVKLSGNQTYTASA